MSTAGVKPLAAFYLCAALGAQDAAGLLGQVDRLLRPWPAFGVDLTVEAASRLPQAWHLSLRKNGDFRLEERSNQEAGRCLLSLGTEQWLILPGTRHPLRLGPNRLATGGFPDAGLLDLARNYRTVDLHTDERGLQQLTLEALHPARTHRKLVLWWDANEARPVEAELFLASGRLSQRLRFEKPSVSHGRRLVPGFRLEPTTGSPLQVKLGPWTPVPPPEACFEVPKVAQGNKKD